MERKEPSQTNKQRKTIKTGFFAIVRINVCFNGSFLDFNQYCK